MKEKYYIGAMDEYIKRLKRYCSLEIEEIGEARVGADPAENEILAALEKESFEIKKHIPASSYVVAMCIEGEKRTSEDIARLLSMIPLSGGSRLCFIIGGSFGLHKSVKDMADLEISMSDMTFPHHLARVMLLEQLYRAFSINAGAKYHK